MKILENGGDLIDYCRENPSPVDLLLLDIVMPEIDGYAAFWELKELKYNTRVVFISVENTAGIIKNVLANGAYDFITKPLKRDTILERVKNVMKKPLV